MPADVVHVQDSRLLDGAASGGQEADHDAAGIGGVGFANDQPLLLHAPGLVGQSALLPLEQRAKLLRRHSAGGVLREHGEDLVVGLGESGVQEQMAAQTYGEPVSVRA